MNDLDQLKNWVGSLLAKLSPQERHKRTSSIPVICAAANNNASANNKTQTAHPIRHANRANAANAAAPCSAKSALPVNSTSEQIAIAFRGRIACIHQYGLRDKPDRKGRDVQYVKRELLGFTNQEVKMIEEKLIDYLGQ